MAKDIVVSAVKLPKQPFVSVVWDDAWGDMTAAVSMDDVHQTHKPERIVTRGWLLLSDEVGISLANEICADGTFRGRSFVLRGMVVDVIYHTVGRKRERKKKEPACDSLPPSS